jgi:uncharacterized membrane protein
MVIVNSIFSLKLLTALGCGLMAGVFFAFSTFVMNALARLQPDRGIMAMQSINITAISPLFMTVLFGTAAGCSLLTIFVLSNWHHQPSAAYLLIGSLSYLIGTVIVTIGFNVPLNETLAKVEPTSAEGAAVWANYLATWTNWNHVRTIAALAATALIICSL